MIQIQSLQKYYFEKQNSDFFLQNFFQNSLQHSFQDYFPSFHFNSFECHKGKHQPNALFPIYQNNKLYIAKKYNKVVVHKDKNVTS